MEYLDLCGMREVGYTSTKPHFANSLSAQAFKVYSFVTLCERHIQNQHMVTVWGLSFQVRTHHGIRGFFCWWLKQRCIAVAPPFWIEGELPVFVVRPHAPNREVRTVP